jgi:hypothetical protein
LVFERARRAKLSDHVPYDLRHTFTVTLLTKSTPLTYVTEQMGHKKPITTFLYCAHWISAGRDKSFVDSPDEPLGLPQTPVGTSRRKVAYLQGNMAESNLNICYPPDESSQSQEVKPVPKRKVSG